MLDRLVAWAVRNRLLVVLALSGAIGVGGLMLQRLNLDAFPDVTNIQVTVNTEAPGLAAEEVEQLITYPIEAVMYALPDVQEVRSISKTGLSIVTIVFGEGTDVYFARQLVFERLQDAREQIPPGVGVPEMGPNTSGLGQVFQYILRTDDPERFDAMGLRGLNDWVVKLLLMPVEGVTDVLSFGGEVRQYQVLADPKRLLSYDLSVQELAEAIEENNRNAGGWFLDRGAEQLTIRGVGWVRPDGEGLRDIGNIPLKDLDGVPVRVRDLAEVAFGPEIRQGAVTMSVRDGDGTARPMGEVVAGIVLKRMGANTKAAIDGIKARLPIIQQALPEGVAIEPFYDQADLVEKAVATVARALAQAFVLIRIVLAPFLLNIRATLLVLLSIPLSVRLRDLAQVAIESGPPQIRRDDVQRLVVVEANLVGRDMGSLVHEIDRRVAGEIDLPPGYSVVFGGQFESQQRAQQRLAIVVPLSLGLIFLLLYFAFHSVGQALLIMINVPLALIGGVVALYVSGLYLSVPGSIGFIAVFGIAVLNGVVMVNAINQNVDGGMTLSAALLEGALSRLRPVLMTALTTVLGLAPLLYATGVGSEVQRPLATVVVGGLVSSTLLTLLVLPVLYEIFSRGRLAGSVGVKPRNGS